LNRIIFKEKIVEGILLGASLCIGKLNTNYVGLLKKKCICALPNVLKTDNYR